MEGEEISRAYRERLVGQLTNMYVARRTGDRDLQETARRKIKIIVADLKDFNRQNPDKRVSIRMRDIREEAFLNAYPKQRRIRQAPKRKRLDVKNIEKYYPE